MFIFALNWFVNIVPLITTIVTIILGSKKHKKQRFNTNWYFVAIISCPMCYAEIICLIKLLFGKPDNLCSVIILLFAYLVWNVAIYTVMQPLEYNESFYIAFPQTIIGVILVYYSRCCYNANIHIEFNDILINGIPYLLFFSIAIVCTLARKGKIKLDIPLCIVCCLLLVTSSYLMLKTTHIAENIFSLSVLFVQYLILDFAVILSLKNEKKNTAYAVLLSGIALIISAFRVLILFL